MRALTFGPREEGDVGYLILENHARRHPRGALARLTSRRFWGASSVVLPALFGRVGAVVVMIYTQGSEQWWFGPCGLTSEYVSGAPPGVYLPNRAGRWAFHETDRTPGALFVSSNDRYRTPPGHAGGGLARR